MLLAAGSLRCAGAAAVSTPTANPGEPPPVLVHAITPSSGSLVFPPPPTDGRAARPPLPEEYAPIDPAGPLRVVEPKPDAQGQFSLRGQSVVVRFSRAMAGAKTGAPAGDTVRLEPPVAGQARWVDTNAVEFTAAAPFDPKARYALIVAGAKAADGAELEQPFRAAFRATPIVVVGGKTLDYVPEPGKPRVVVVRPDAALVSRQPTFSVLFDQPVELARAPKLVTLHRVTLGQGPSQQLEAVPLTISHAARNELQGIAVDRRFVLLARPTRPLAHGTAIELVARDLEPAADAEPTVIRAKVAEPLEQQEIQCSYWSGDGDRCSYANGVLSTSGKEIHVRFNNRIGGSPERLRGQVQVTPPVRNLRVVEEGWEDGRLVIGGDFRPSTSYQVVLSGLRDVFGAPLAAPIRFRVQTAPLGASVTIPEGLMLLDPPAARSFPLHSRNVAEAELALWPVPEGDAGAFRTALRGLGSGALDPVQAPKHLPVSIKAKADELVASTVDLTSELGAGTSWLMTARVTRFAFGAAAMRFPEGSEASRPSVALVRIGQPNAIAVHLHRTPDAALVHVARLRTGEPVAGALVGLADATSAAAGGGQRTDALGVASFPLTDGLGEQALLRVEAGSERLLLPLGQSDATAEGLFPALASGSVPGAIDRRAVLVTDRGIYRPRSFVEVRTSAYRLSAQGMRPLAGTLLRLRLVGPTGETVASPTLLTGELGSSATRLEIDADAKLGKYQLVLEDPLRPSTPLATGWVRVAEFEAPRFAVDVLADEQAARPNELRATIRGRYLFGTAMNGSPVSWTLRRSEAELPAGPMSAAGLSFRAEPRWYDDEGEESGAGWSRTGEGTLDQDGLLAVVQPIALEAEGGPQRFELEADVSDSSARHVAGRVSVVRHPAPRYAGLKGPRGWVGVGDSVPIELGVVGTDGAAVVGASVTARLQRLEWRSVRQRTAAGAVRWQYTTVRQDVGRCTVKSEAEPKACSLRVARSGDYEVLAEVDGRASGRASFWAWRDGEPQVGPVPTRGSVLPIVADKASYAPGERAKLMLRNPYPAAIAVLTTEMGGLLAHESKRIVGPVGVLEVPLAAAHAPHVNATVTLLPVGASGEELASHRIGAIRLPVSLADARLDLDVRTDRPSYQPGDEAEISLWVRDRGQAEARAEVALAVVDEGVLRLTGFHPPDPALALRPGFPLEFSLSDTRQGLAELIERSHVAGGGGAGEEDSVASARRNFVETALWRPLLRTDARGQTRVRFKLPDNLTEFRVMAVALDDEGKGATTETSFQVRKPVMLDPVLPRFAAVGDRFEAGAIVHNTGSQPFHGIVRLGEREKPVSVEGGGRERVGFSIVADRPGPLSLSMSVADTSGVRDRVVRELRVAEPGITQRPHLAGVFKGKESVALRLPPDAIDDGDGALHVKVGQHLWPELGSRLDYLLDFPHGCVEQTTSGTLPLIAARDILPRIGFTRLNEQGLRERIRAGIDRLGTMRTPSGGLAYWPGGDEPNVYGTAYAIRAVILAKQAGVTPPAALLDGMQGYLASALSDGELPAEVRLAIAQSLSELDALPDSAVDALVDLANKSSVFGKASLALALARSRKQQDRVERLLDAVEESFSADGALRARPQSDDFYYFGSDVRTRAQAAIALGRLRPGSRLVPLLVNDLAAQTGGYTTQATAYSLLALAEHLRHTVGDGAAFELRLDGQPLAGARDLGVGSKEFRVPLAELRGKTRTLELVGPGDVAVAYLLDASYRVPLGASATGSGAGAASAAGATAAATTLAATTAKHGPSVYRVYSDVAGSPVDVRRVKTGDVVRVALLVRMPTAVPSGRRGYVALTDRLPAGFEPVDPDLATVAQVPELSEAHPFSRLLRWSSAEASHVELRDDRVLVYFDRVWGDELAATYLARATTPGHYVLPPASAELMYEPDSLSYSESSHVVVQ